MKITAIFSLFRCGPHECRTIPGLATRLKLAGVRHLEMDALDALAAPAEVPWCKANGWRLIVTGDNFMRTWGDRVGNCTEEKVTATARAIRKVCDGIEMVDEVKQDPGVYAPYAKRFIDWWSDSGGPQITWPGHAPQRWEKDYWSEYISRQWAWYTKDITQKQRLDRLRGSLIDVPHDGRDICALIAVAGMYRKLSPGTGKGPKDRWISRPPTVKQIEEQIDLALSLGANRLRCYALDVWFHERAQAKIGTTVQVGIGPSDGRWDGFLEVVRKVMGK